MNKNLLVIIFFYVLSISALMGQSEVTLSQDDENVSSYWLNTVPFYSLPRIKAGKYYGSLLEIKIPRDTIRSTGGRILKVHVKQIRIINVEGIPEGLSYSPTIVDKDDHKYFSFFLELYGRTKSKTSSNIVAKMSVTFTLNNGKSLVRAFNIKNISYISVCYKKIASIRFYNLIDAIKKNAINFSTRNYTKLSNQLFIFNTFWH